MIYTLKWTMSKQTNARRIKWWVFSHGVHHCPINLVLRYVLLPAFSEWFVVFLGFLVDFDFEGELSGIFCPPLPFWGDFLSSWSSRLGVAWEELLVVFLNSSSSSSIWCFFSSDPETSPIINVLRYVTLNNDLLLKITIL